MACQSDGSSGGQPKKEVLVKEVVLDSAVVDIVYLGKNHECVLVTTKSKRLYFSENEGRDWNEITNKVSPSSDLQLEVERVMVNPTDKTVAVLQTKAKRADRSDAPRLPYIYVTEDSGRNWRRAMKHNHGLHNWISHPTNRDWALVSWWSGNCNSAGQAQQKSSSSSSSSSDSDSDDDSDTSKDEKQPCVHRLMITKDLGRNFNEIVSYVVQFSWGSPAHDQTNRVYYTAYRTKKGDQGQLSLWTTEVDFSYVDVSRAGRVRRPVEAMKHGNKFLVAGGFILVARVSDVARQTVHLMVSRDGAATFKAALLPSGMGELEEKWYTVLDTSEGAVILHISSGAEGATDTGRIFISDSEGYRYSQSLAGNVRSGRGECEFDKVISLQGVYLANIVVPDSTSGADQSISKAKEKAAEVVEKEASDGAEVDKKHGRGMNKGQSQKAAKTERTIRTVVSFDKGGAWSYLKPPRVDSRGKGYECAGKPAQECALHLHGTTSWDYYAPFYSSESAVGIVMATGNVGSTLRFEPEETNTFLSRDGGLTWVEAHQGAFIYEFGDHGGLIVMADDLKKTSEVVFTWNEGQSWYDFKVSKTPFEVDNIITEPNVTATTFIMFGTREEGVGVLYYMKFDSLQFPTCKGAWAADSVSSDYETWSPSDGSSNDKCLLGQQVTYTRRKRISQCWNGEKFERPVVQKTCTCTKEDFACNIGFVRPVGSTECVYGGDDMMPERLIPATCSGSYKANAYRKVPGDKCEGGWQPQDVDVSCPRKSLVTGSTKWAVFATLLAGIFYVAYGKFCSGNSPNNKFGEFSAAAKSRCTPMGIIVPVIGGFQWLYGKICSGGRGFESFSGVGYKRVQGNEFDLDMTGGNEESLTDFIDEAEYDDSAPRVYDRLHTDDKKSFQRPREESNRQQYVSGGIETAADNVPRLQAPPRSGGAHQSFDIGQGDQDLL